MVGDNVIPLFRTENWLLGNQGPRYLQLSRYVARLVHSQELPQNTRLPSEREIADAAGISRVTVRKAIEVLAQDGLIQRKQGSGNYVADIHDTKKLEQSLSTLSSFTEHIQTRGMDSSSRVLDTGIYPPSPTEILSLGLASDDLVARVKRLRSADGIPMAIENSSLPLDILPNPSEVTQSLYDVLRRGDHVPSRAIQKIGAVSLRAQDAELFKLPEGSAVLKIDRTAYLNTGRPIEFTCGIYRSDLYEFMSELRLRDHMD